MEELNYRQYAKYQIMAESLGKPMLTYDQWLNRRTINKTTMKTRKQFLQYFEINIEPFIPGKDLPALREAWNNEIDTKCKSGELPDRARDWSHPRRFYRYGSEENPNRSSGYKRKTEDVYEIRGDYGHGFECVTTEETRKAAREQLKTYRDNEPGIAFKIVVKRVKMAGVVLSAN